MNSEIFLAYEAALLNLADTWEDIANKYRNSMYRTPDGNIQEAQHRHDAAELRQLVVSFRQKHCEQCSAHPCKGKDVLCPAFYTPEQYKVLRELQINYYEQNPDAPYLYFPASPNPPFLDRRSDSGSEERDGSDQRLAGGDPRRVPKPLP